MKIQYYLRPDTSFEKPPGGAPRIGETILNFRNGYLVLEVDNRYTDPPTEVLQHVFRVVVSHGSAGYQRGITRRPGLYRLGEAEGTVDNPLVAPGAHACSAEVNASTKEEALALWDKILEGSIAPEKDYSAPQVLVPELNVDRLAQMETLAADLATSLLEQAMRRLQDRIQMV